MKVCYMLAQRPCSICGRPVVQVEARRPVSFPFCSSRCRDRDLARWFSGSYAVASVPDFEDTLDPQQP